MNSQQLVNFFTYHAPTPEQSDKFAFIREKAKVLALLADAHETFDRASGTVASAFTEFQTAVTNLCPNSREKTQALAAVQTAMRLYPDATKDWEAIVDVIRNAVMWANASIACNPVTPAATLLDPSATNEPNLEPQREAAKPFVL